MSLFGNPDHVRQISETEGIELASVESQIHWLTPRDWEPFSIPLSTRLQLQATTKGKSLDVQTLSALTIDPLMQAGELLFQGKVDAVIAGATLPTAQVIRAAIATVGLAAGIRTVSGAFLMIRETPTPQIPPCYFVFADCGVVIEPTLPQLVDIAKSSIDTWSHIYGIFAAGVTPKTAFLSFSTKGSADHPSAKKMAEASELFKKTWPDFAVDGELQFDAAFVESVGQRKAPGSTVAGKANCFVFPDLNSGNIGYKIAQRLGGFTAIGPILQGLAKPYSDLSRGASCDDIIIASYVNMLRRKH